jgi:hypothetical protein
MQSGQAALTTPETVLGKPVTVAASVSESSRGFDGRTGHGDGYGNGDRGSRRVQWTDRLRAKTERPREGAAGKEEVAMH